MLARLFFGPPIGDDVFPADRVDRLTASEQMARQTIGIWFRYALSAVMMIAFDLLAAAAIADEQIDYLRDVKPILKARCYSCHAALKQESGLRLDTGRLIRQGGDSGAAIARGKSSESLLVERVSAADEFERMPPEGEPLTEQQIAVLKAWIDQGAQAPDDEQTEEDPREHWAFKRPVRPPWPDVENARWGANPIDAFIAVEHQRRGLTPLPQAEKQILLRRVYLDLVGLPPTRAELRAFLADESPNAYQKVVQRLLESEHYGERWGRHWMDVWRYSDWYGRRQVGDVRNSYPHIWRWRDWIIDSLNEDKGYDQMIREMLAADELYPTDDSRMPALGFIVRNWFSLNYDTWKQDLVEHTGKAFLGMRLNCAHCHDHKYDPITQEEYFRFRAFFEPLEFRHDRVPGGPALTKYVRYKPGSGASLKPIEAGLPRVYDLYEDEKTFMYRLGDTRDRFDRPPVSPAAPAILGGDRLPIEPVELPPAAWYPALKSFVQEDESQKREAAVTSAREALAKATSAAEPLKQELAKAERQLAEAEKDSSDAPQPPPRSIDDLIAWWRFEGADDENGFLADSSGNGHTLKRVTGADPPTAPFGLVSNGATKAFLKPLPGDGADNLQAAEFQQHQSFAYLAADGSARFYANSFTLEAFVHFDVASPDFNRTIADYEGCWTLLHRGLDERTFELRLLYRNQQGELRDVATASATAGKDANEKLVLRTGQDYYICLVVANDTVTLWAADLTAGSPLQSFQFARSAADVDFSTLARPADDTRFKIGNSDGTGRVDGLIDEVRYTGTALQPEQIAAAVGQSTSAAVRQAAAAVAARRRVHESARLGVAAAEMQLAAAQAELKAIRAGIAADQTRYAGAVGDAGVLAAAAVTAQREARLAASRAKLAQAEKQLADSRAPDKADAKQTMQAEQSAAAARKAIDELEQAPAEESAEYPPLGPQYPRTSTGRRRALANWIGNRDNPLTARVAVNHIWMRHFGRPLVESVFDFGRSGKKPTHPALLDWLAVELMDHDWSMKHLHRLIVTSNTYRLSSRPGGSGHPNFAIDKDNTYWWKFDRRRLEAEIIRDSMLYVSGQLDTTLGGPEIQSDDETTSRRRSLYFTVYPEAGGAMRFLTLFDPPDPIDCYRRTDSVVPQQALAMSNSLLSLNQGRQLAGQLSEQLRNDTDRAFIVSCFEQVLCRRPNSEEQEACREFLTRQLELYQEAEAEQLKASAEKGAVAPATDLVQRARESLVRTLFNHNDFIMVH